jgi:hypothetical protein
MNNCVKVTGNVNNVFRLQNTLNIRGIKLYNTPALAALLYSSENWTIQARDARRITAKIKYMRKTAGYTWTDYITNTKIAKELNVTLVLEKIQE